MTIAEISDATPRKGGPKPLLPEGDEIARQRVLPVDKRPTLQDIAERYGVSRQAVQQRLKKWVDRNPSSPLAAQVVELSKVVELPKRSRNG